MEEKLNKLNERLEGCENMLKLIMDEKMFYNHKFEINFIFNNFSQFASFGWQDKYLQLINNLDDESINTVQRIIRRIKTVLELKKGNIDFFTPEEKTSIFHNFDYFTGQIIQIAEDVWAYKKYMLPLPHFESNVFVYDCLINEFSSLDSLKERSIIDVGGYVGDSALVLRKYSEAPIYVFEPDDRNYGLMQKTIQLNNLENIVTEKYVLGDCNKEISLSAKGSMSIVDDGGEEKLQQITLDDYVKSNNVKVGLIKVDIEGYEIPFLLGAKETIISQRPKLLISIYHNFEQFFDVKPLLEGWGLNYKFKIVKPADGAIVLETVLIGESAE